MKKVLRLLLSVSAFTAIAVFSTAPALAAKPINYANFKSKPAPIVETGNDVSWPQCGKSLPKGQLFGIVGVNNGLANATNPCLATQLAWANTSTGLSVQPKVSLYVNTANPGLAGSWWPTSNVYGGTSVNNPYGQCNGTDTAACAYMYGYAKAFDDANIRGISNPSSFRWWLDVETINSWESNTARNVADLEGMTAYFTSIGAQVGLYSTATQWNQITGNSVMLNSNLNGLMSWLAGARNLSDAKNKCDLPALTLGGFVMLTQYVATQTDFDYSCV